MTKLSFAPVRRTKSDRLLNDIKSALATYGSIVGVLNGRVVLANSRSGKPPQGRAQPRQSCADKHTRYKANQQ